MGDSRIVNGEDVAADPRVSALTLDEFYNVRYILETFEDLSILADVLKHATNCDDSIVLASAADTINYHIDSFYVIGATTDLFRRLFVAYCRLKRLGKTSLNLLFSLIELGLQVPGESNAVAVLRQDISRVETKSVLAVPSPVSDHVPDISIGADPSLPKLDQLLSCGGCIDETTLDSVFSVLTTALEPGSEHTKLSGNDISRYLALLRCFHPRRFDSLLVRWICDILKSSARPPLLKFLPPLIGVGCITIPAFISLVENSLQHDIGWQAIPNVNLLKMDLLQLLVPQTPNQDSCLDLV